MIVAGFKSADSKAQKVIEALNKADPSLTYFGLGDQILKANPKFRNYGDLATIQDK